MRILKRTIQSDIENWIKDTEREFTLSINGVRRCGKTTQIEYALNKFVTSNWIKFDLTNPEDLDFLRTATFSSVEDFLQIINNYSEIEFDNNTIIFIDEIQEDEQIYFFIKRYYDYIMQQKISGQKIKNNILISGSYINSVVFNKRYKPLTGVLKSKTMYPLSFYEFLMNINKGEQIIERVRTKLLNKEPLDNITHKNMLKILNDYFIVGGFPVNVIKYLNNPKYFNIDEINEYTKNEIIRFQKEDIKYGVSNKVAIKLVDMYDSISQGFKNNGNKIEKFKFSYLKSDPSKYNGSAELNINILSKSQIILPIIKTIGSNCEIDSKKNYKLLYCDMSILNNMVNVNYDQGNFKGWVGEHFVGLEIDKYFNEITNLKYWYKAREFDTKPGWEIDYILKGNIPIEVKNSNKKSKKRSLEFFKKHTNFLKKGIVISLKKYGEDSPLFINFPMYAIWLLKEFIEQEY